MAYEPIKIVKRKMFEMKKIFSTIIILIVVKCTSAQTTNYEYDKLYRLTKITYSNGSTVTYQYDANGNRVLEVKGSTGPLPVNLLSFNISKITCNTAELIWQTAQEQNNAGFEVQQSNSAGSFKNIGFVAGSGTSSTLQSYKFQAPDLADGNYYFRLKQNDANGAFKYSAVVTTKIACNKSLLTLVPNPAQNQIAIKGLDNSKPHNIQIFDSKGALVKTLNGIITNPIAITELSKGVYLLKIDDNESLKFVKQ